MPVFLRRTSALLLRQYYLLRGSPARVVPLFSWVAIDIILWGFITRYLNSVSGARFDFVPAMLGAVLLWDFMARVMQGITTAFLEDVWSRNFLNLFASPLSVSEYLGGLVLSSIATSAIGLVVMVALATLVFGLSFFVDGAMLAAFLLVLFCSESPSASLAARWFCDSAPRRSGSSGPSLPSSRRWPASFTRSRRCPTGCSGWPASFRLVMFSKACARFSAGKPAPRRKPRRRSPSRRC